MKLTAVGEVVRKHDPEFTTLTTQWLLHHELVTDSERSEAWHFFAGRVPAEARLVHKGGAFGGFDRKAAAP